MSSFKFSVFSFQFSVICFLLMILILFSCRQNYTPKPPAYFRIDFPEREYRMYDTISPFMFEYPVYGNLAYLIPPVSDSCWLNINFPKYKGTIHLSYRKIDSNLDQLMEDSWKFVYSKIAMRADAVNRREYENPELNVYGTIYDIKGDAASTVQFFVTDSVKHFLRGSLYFSVQPNYDSLAPAIHFFREDIIHLIETVKWK